MQKHQIAICFVHLLFGKFPLCEEKIVLIVGATGLFGGLLARRLVQEAQFKVIGAGRNEQRLASFSDETGAETVVIDRNNIDLVNEALLRCKPFAVVDCAGPFQYYGARPYEFAASVIKAGSHYLDIADASEFVAGIHLLNRSATDNAVVAISGASSTPAIAAAIADDLVQGFSRVVSVETAIIPGNRTRRTLPVMQAIIGQVGQPFQATVDGRLQTLHGWSDTRCISLKVPEEQPVTGRLASLVNTPDVALFPIRYQAQTVTLRAGLELRFFHRGLQLLGWLVRLRLMRSLLPLTPLARSLASRFEQFGSACGGMQVVVSGRKHNGDWVRCYWDLAVDDGRGPEIPTLPVSVLLDGLAKGDVPPGARAAPGETDLARLNERFREIGAQTVTYETVLEPVFKTVLGRDFESLPAAVRALHNHIGTAVYRGQANSKGPTGISGRLAAWVFGFPAAANKVPITVTIDATENCERWQRVFAGSAFRSTLSRDKAGYMQERFGPMNMRLGLQVNSGRLYYPVLSAKLFNLIPVPKWLLPKSIAHETVDEYERFVFDVALYTPFGARIAHYRGLLIHSDSNDD